MNRIFKLILAAVLCLSLFSGFVSCDEKPLRDEAFSEDKFATFMETYLKVKQGSLDTALKGTGESDDYAVENAYIAENSDDLKKHISPDILDYENIRIKELRKAYYFGGFFENEAEMPKISWTVLDDIPLDNAVLSESEGRFTVGVIVEWYRDSIGETGIEHYFTVVDKGDYYYLEKDIFDERGFTGLCVDINGDVSFEPPYADGVSD